MEVLSNYTSA